MTVLQDVFDGAASALAGALQNAGPEFAPVAIAVTAVDGLVDADFGIIAASSGNSDNYETGLALAAEALGFAAALAAGTAAAPLIAPAVAAWGLTGAAATVAEYIALSAAGVGYGGIVSDAAEELGNFIRGALPQIPSWIDRTTGGVNNAQNDPLIFNMSGTGLTLKSTSETSPFFDFTGSGVAEQTAWLGAGNGLLTTAVPGLGSTSGLLTTFAQLVSFDTNGDGVISGQELDNIFYWSDANSDGAAEQGEISSLSDLGVVSIALATKELNEAIVGGVIEQEAVATMSDGSTREIASVQLQANPLSTIYTGAYSLTSAVEDLLNFKGYGALPDLRISMSQSDQLLDLVKTLQATDPNDSAAFDSSLQAVLYQWAGVGNVEPGSGQLFDGQKLAFLQALTNNYQSFFGTVEPHFIGQANYLQESWDSAFAALKARALVQTPSSPFGVDFVYTIALDAIVPTVSFTAAITDLASNVPADSQARVAYWSNALDIINESVLSLSSIIAVDSSAIAAQLQAVLPPSFSASQISAAASGNLSFVEGTALTKVLVGTIGSDLFQATAPGTELEGFGGGDLFIVETGLGSTEVNEIDNVAHPSNILLIEGVEPAQVTVSGDAAGDIILSLGDGSSIKIDEMLFQASYQSENAQGHNSIGANNQTAFGVQEVEFADGTVWTAAKVQAAEVADQAGNTSIYGTSGSDLIDGRGIATYEQGNGGGDTFVYDQGYGQLEIDEVDPSALPDNVLRFGAGITADEVTVMGDSLGDVTLTDGTTGDRIQIDGMLNSAKDGVQAIDFADGSVWTTAQILSLATTGTTGSDDLYGTSGANVFDGKGDSDYEQGDGGGDTFIFNQGYGTLEVNEYDTSRSNTNILALGTGINAVDLQISGDAAGDIVIKTGEAVDAIILENMLVSGRYGVQGVAFADGTVWTAAQVEALATTGTPGSDNLYGTSGPDTFDGKGGSDYEQGNGGGDTFIFNAGSGSLEINEQDSNPNNYNILTFGSGIQTSDIAVGADATGDVILTVGSGGDRVQIDNMLDGPQYGVQAVAFADGTVWSAASIVAGLPAGTAPRSSDYAQSLAFAEGDGPVTSNPIPGEIVAGEGISAANLILQSDAGGDLILKIEGTTDGLTVRDDFTYQSSGVVSQISGIRLADGSLIELPTYTQHEPADFTWQGSSTDLSLSGSNYGDNTFDLAPGGDTVTFGNSSDGGPGTNSVLFDKGDGNALINLDGGTGAITLAADIESSDVVLQADNTGDLTIELLDTGETLTVIDDLTPSSSIGAIGVSSSINELHFSDGSKVSLSAETGTNTPLVFTWIGSATDHTLVGSDLGSNTFIPGADGDSVTFGSRSVVGAATNLLNYSIGNGRVTLDLNGGTGAVEMGIGITQANLTFQADAVGDLTILDGTAGDSVVIENDLFSDKYGWNARLGAVNFSDGTSEAFNGGMTFTWTGTAVNTVLTGSGFGANVFNLAPGGDTVTLGNGSGSGSNRNTVNYGPGDGAATINMNGDNGSATLVFGKGITASDLIFQVDDSTGNLTILDGVAGDRVIIESDLFSDKYGWNARLSALSFGNGTAEVLSSGITFTWTGTATNTVLTGSGFGANVFNVAPGGDTVTLGNGSDSGSTKNTVNYGAGDGAATIDLNGNNGNATLAFGAGITASDLTFQSDAAGDLIILDGTAGDSVVIKDALYLDNFGGGVRLNNLTFSDGASKSLSIGMTFTWTATATATVLTGSGFGANVFNLAPGSDSVTFGNGSQSGSNWNTVNFAAGDGAVTINMNGASGALVLGTGIQISDLVFGQNAQGNETVAIDNTGDEVTFTNVSSNPLIDVDFDGAIYTAFVGASGNDRLYGSNSADVFDGRGGSDYEQGYGGGDIFIYNAGYGQLEINENGSGLNVLQVGGGITAAGVQVSDDNNGNVFLTDGVSGDRIQLDGELYGVGSGVEQMQFADGTVLSQSQLLAMATTGSSAGESLYGTGGAELFDSKGLATYERGNGGGDIFLYNAGYGQLEINENGSGLNLLQVGGGITAAGVQVSDDRNGNVFLTDGVGGDRIQLDGELYGVGSGVEQVQFADGTTWTQAQLVTMATTGTSAGQGLYGNGNANVFDSKGLATYEQGNGGGDTFIYNAGYGQLEINENGNGLNVLQLGNGITAAGVQVSDDRNGNVFLTDGVSGDRIQLDGELYGVGSGVEQVQFADGTVLSQSQLLAMATTGSSAGESLYGTGGAELFDSKGLATYEQGNGGGDTFIYNAGYGQLEINENGNGLNVLQLGNGITADDVQVSEDSSGNVYLTDGTSGDRIQLSSETGGTGSGVDQVQFADGTTWSQSQLIAIATARNSGVETLYGTSGPDTLDSEDSNAYEQGNGGGDRFIYNVNYGQLEINESGRGVNVLQIGQGISPASITLATDSAGDVILNIGSTITGGTVSSFVGGQTNSNYAGGPLISGSGATITMTDGGGDEAGSWFTNQKYAVGAFTASFDYQAQGTADGMAFILQDSASGPSALGGVGGSLGYSGISNSAAIELNLYSGHTQGTAFASDGNTGNYTSTGDVAFWNGDEVQVQLSYDGSTMAERMTDFTTGAVYSASYAINLASILGSGSAYVGFSGGTGGATSTQTVSNFTFQGGVSNVIRLDNEMDGDGQGVEQVQFADGTVWTQAQIAAMTGSKSFPANLVQGSTGDDNLNGTSGSDIFDGQGGSDYERGNGGGDIFLYNAGYGQLEINENGSGLNLLQVGGGITAAGVQVSDDRNGNVFLTDGVGGDRIQLDGELYGVGSGVEQVQFADGTTWTQAQLVTMATTGTSAGQGLYGNGGANVFDSKGLATYEQGNGGGDTFIYNAGYGQLEINENGNGLNVLQLGNGITAAGVQVSDDRNGNVFLTDGVSGDRIQLDGELYGVGSGVEQVQFADGTVLSQSQLLAMATTGSSAGESLYGTGGAELFDSKGLATYEQGNGGGDTFIYNAGYGQLEINENGNGLNVLHLGNDVQEGGVAVSTSGSNVLLTDGVAGDRVQLDSETNGPGQGVSAIDFADGTSWSQTQLQFLCSHGSTGSEVLQGTMTSDILDGRGGTDTLIGGGGNDTYIFKAGYGSLTIENGTSTGLAAAGQLDLSSGLTASNLWFSQSGDDLLMQVIGSADVVDVKGWFGGNASAALTKILGGDGRTLDSGIDQLVSEMASYQTSHSLFNAATATAMPTDPTLRSALATAWH